MNVWEKMIDDCFFRLEHLVFSVHDTKYKLWNLEWIVLVDHQSIFFTQDKTTFFPAWINLAYQKCQSTGQKHIFVDNLYDVQSWWESSLSGVYCRCGVQNYAVAVRGWSHQSQPPPGRPGNYFNLHKVNGKWVPIESKMDTLSFMRWAGK